MLRGLYLFEKWCDVPGLRVTILVSSCSPLRSALHVPPGRSRRSKTNIGLRLDHIYPLPRRYIPDPSDLALILSLNILTPYVDWLRGHAERLRHAERQGCRLPRWTSPLIPHPNDYRRREDVAASGAREHLSASPATPPHSAFPTSRSPAGHSTARSSPGSDASTLHSACAPPSRTHRCHSSGPCG